MDRTSETVNGWNEYKRLVLQQLEDLNKKYERIDEKIGTISNKVTILETKSTLLGAAGGLIIVILIEFIKQFIIR